MTIREAIASDFQAIGEVCAAAFMDEECMLNIQSTLLQPLSNNLAVYGDLKHPRRRDYPEDFVNYFFYKIGKHWLDPTRIILVSVDDASSRVVGMADWERQGKNSLPLREMSDPRHPENPLNVAFLQKAAAFENRAADIPKLSILEDTSEIISHFWSGEREENWFLDLLAVHPDYEGKGHGRRLVQWGIDEAKKEGIATSVVAAYEKDGFYEHLGFVKVGMATVGPMAEVGLRGGTILFIDKKKRASF